MSSIALRRLGTVLSLALLAVGLASEPVGAEQSGGGGVVVSLDGSISPRYIPRHRSVPITLTLGGRIASVDGSPPPQLQRIEIAFGARGGVETAGLATCPLGRLRNATRRQALDRCSQALVGQGEVTAEVPLNPEKPLLAHTEAFAFNGIRDGRPAVWVHASSTSPPVSFVLPFYLRRLGAGAYGVLMRSPVRSALGSWPRLRSFRISLGRRYGRPASPRSYLSAHCPLPPSLSIGIVPLARATYRFLPRPTLTTTILRGCRVRR